MLRTDILTNQNHPSVMLWSIANELRDAGQRARGALHLGRGRAGAQARPDAASRDGGPRLARGRLPEGVCPARRDRGQRVLRLVRRRRRRLRRPRRAQPIPRQHARVLSDEGDVRHASSASTATATARSRNAGPTSSGQHGRLPPRRVREQALAVGRDLVRAAGLRRQARLGRGRPARRSRPTSRRACSTSRATRSPCFEMIASIYPPTCQIAAGAGSRRVEARRHLRRALSRARR